MSDQDLLYVLQEAVGQCAHSVIITDKEGKLQYTNPQFSLLTGYNSDEVKGMKSWLLLADDTSRSMFFHISDALRSGKQWQGEIRNKRKDGSIYWGFLTVSHVRNKDGQVTHYLGVAEDISNRKSLEYEANKTLESLARSVEEMKYFTAMVAHHLRAPLATVTSAFRILGREGGKDSNEVIERALNTTKQMSDFIHDLLLYTRVEMDRPVFDSVLLNEPLYRAISNLESEVLRLKGEVRYGTLPVAYGDRSLLVDLFQNLIENSLKYCDQVPLINVESEVVGNFCKILVMDNGIGINGSDTAKVFEPFKRLETPGREMPGTGLGLSLCKKIVEAHCGEIGIEPRAEGGTLVWFTLPCASEDSAK